MTSLLFPVCSRQPLLLLLRALYPTILSSLRLAAQARPTPPRFPFLLGLPLSVPLLHLRPPTMTLMILPSLLRVLLFLTMRQQVAPLPFPFPLFPFVYLSLRTLPMFLLQLRRRGFQASAGVRSEREAQGEAWS